MSTTLKYKKSRNMGVFFGGEGGISPASFLTVLDARHLRAARQIEPGFSLPSTKTSPGSN